MAAKEMLKGKVALVTGGSRGIGRAITDSFFQQEASVVTCGRSARPEQLPTEIDWLSADVSSMADVQSLYQFIDEKYGGLDILVNNAGIQIEKTILDTSDEDWERLIGVNAKGVFYCCRELIPLMAKNNGGSIINIGSISANHADPAMALYNASKAFVHGLTRSIAVDHGSAGIRCNAICPGWIMTGMADAAFDLASNAEAAKNDAIARHPVGRFGNPEDIANTALWLASDQSSFATGQTFTIDGGLTSASPLQPGLS
jgi:NAD(P)-dependent dehydrogenase (short-subunit alcohol dehydrogenase family)